MSVIRYAFELDTGTDYTNASLGISSGVVRWITGRSEAGFSPTWGSNERESGSVTGAWATGVFTESCINTCESSVGKDIEICGGYATASSLGITVANNGIATSFDENNVNLENKAGALYIVIDDVFYSRWHGIVESVNVSDVEYKIELVSNFSVINKKLPPKTITKALYPDAEAGSIGKAIPIQVGDVPYAKMYNVGGKPEKIDLVENDGKTFTRAHASHYDESGEVEIALYTKGVSFEENELAGQYIKVSVAPEVIEGEGEGFTDIFTRINSNAATGGVTLSGYSDDETVLYLDNPIARLEANYPGSYLTPGNVTNQYTWWFEVYKSGVEHIVSNREILKYKGGESGQVQIFKYNDDSDTHSEYKTSHSEADKTASNEYGHPYIKINTGVISSNGNPQYYIKAVPKSIVAFKKANTGTDAFVKIDASYLNDSIRTDKGGVSYIVDENEFRYSLSDSGDKIEFYIDMEIPESALDSASSVICVVPDFTLRVPNLDEVSVSVDAFTVNPYGYTDYSESIIEGYTDTIAGSGSTVDIDYTFLPEWYFNENSSDSYASRWATENAQEYFAISKDYVSLVKSGGASNKIQLRLKIENQYDMDGTFVGSVFLHETGFIVSSEIPAYENALSTRVRGELTGASDTSTVYRALQLIAEEYNGISPADVDYGNIPSYRSSWHVGRSIVEQKTAFDYIKELCQNAFIYAFTNRLGKLAFSSWIDNDSDGSLLHKDSVNILRDTISDIKRTDQTSVFNEFEIKYSLNGGDTYDATFTINNVASASTFPLTTDKDANDNLLWKQYVGGLNDNSYADAKAMWEFCRASYDVTGVIRPLPENKSMLDWFIDGASYDPADDELYSIITGTSSSAWKFLEYAVAWCGTKRDYISYRLPINSEYAELDILTPVTFCDSIKTNGENRSGWVTSISVLADEHIIEVTVLLKNNSGVADSYGDIIETGSAANAIDESGSQTDTITEGA